jgi:hypothetical protein
MLKGSVSILFVLLIKFSFSQVHELQKYKSIPEEQIVFNVYHNSWANFPKDFELKPYSAGIDLYLMKDLFGKNKPVSFAGGFGVSVQNYKSNSMLFSSSDSLYFIKIPDSVNYRKNKFSTVYVDIPIEFRLRTRPLAKKRNLKIAFGFKIGYNIQRYTKYEGDNYLNINNYEKVKYKVYNIKNFLPYRYGVFTRLGYGKFSLSAYYSLTPLFETSKAQEIIPFSIGLSITVF